MQNLSFWVDCDNGERVYFDENQLKNDELVFTQNELAISQTDARIACEKGIKARLEHPSSVYIHHFTKPRQLIT